ncbi:DUF934 domain-containing protein [Qingshengfaniella alkalisoli]|uniref:DUF934 domain-containing protein n=1 Tax=Qingshengfaniella alkalisoli TaxID=2599296 RepID=A0A5B8I697_9RHOB|nr:DUF934 domain-containing protein [Qingshengfaniella alkalisoli]QDY68975.1 DUF934 domain-containing protein [Qingshengfaniella alkalisoli]
MSVIVTDTGFAQDDWKGDFVTLAELRDGVARDGKALSLSSASDPNALPTALNDFPLIRVEFPSFADGRGFTIGRQLRSLGYEGRLRAVGHVLADQYGMARRVGFDEVEISDELAARQPEDQWKFRANWVAHHYQARLRA